MLQTGYFNVVKMVKRSKGTLSKKTKKTKSKKKTTVSERVQKFKVGDRVVFEPREMTEGRPHLRYRNRHGVIKEARGRNSYVVEIKDGGKTKYLISNSIHLKAV